MNKDMPRLLVVLLFLPPAFANPIPAPYSLFPVLYVVGLFFIGLATEAFVIKKLKPRFFEDPRKFVYRNTSPAPSVLRTHSRI